MNTSTRLIVVLTGIAVISGAILSFFNILTAERIENYKLEQLRQSVAMVMPGTQDYETLTLSGKVFYLGKDAQGSPTGVAFKAVGNGFQSKLEILVGMDLEMKKILALKVLSQMETPGLGTKIETDPTNKEHPGWFMAQFENLNTLNGIRYVKNEVPDQEGEIQAITGATISSKSVVEILNAAISGYREVFLKREVQ